MRNLILRFIYSFVVRMFLKIIIGVKYNNRDVLNRADQFIVIANHNSHLDTMALMAALPSNKIMQVKPVAAKDYFGKTKLRAKFSNYFINTLLIDRKRDKENLENDPINKIISAIDAGYSLILFPEGTRGEPEKMSRFKAGAAVVLSKRPHVNYIPAYLSGMGKALPRGDGFLVPFSSSVTFGNIKKVDLENIDAILAQLEKDFDTLYLNKK